MAFVLGAIPPAVCRGVLALRGGPGRALGQVAAAGALGAVAGALATGFVLLPSLGTRALVLGVAGALAAGALVFAGRPAGAPARRAREHLPSPGLLRWVVLAGAAGAALLVVEVVAGRVASDRLGNTLYTWTSVLAVVLGALAFGNAAGGWLADRFPVRDLLRTLLLGATAAVVSSVWAADWMAAGEALPASWPLRVLAATAAAFALPALALGTLSPVIVSQPSAWSFSNAARNSSRMSTPYFFRK